MTQQRKTLGSDAEDAAAKYLKKKGYRILERNARNSLGEIDIVAEKDRALVFVEVKAGTSDPDFDPALHFDTKKQRKVLQLAQAYLTNHPNKNGRIDLVVVVQTGKTFQVDHFEDVVEDATS